jgi:hypothetical protein
LNGVIELNGTRLPTALPKQQIAAKRLIERVGHVNEYMIGAGAGGLPFQVADVSVDLFPISRPHETRRHFNRIARLHVFQ